MRDTINLLFRCARFVETRKRVIGCITFTRPASPSFRNHHSLPSHDANFEHKLYASYANTVPENICA